MTEFVEGRESRVQGFGLFRVRWRGACEGDYQGCEFKVLPPVMLPSLSGSFVSATGEVDVSACPHLLAGFATLRPNAQTQP